MRRDLKTEQKTLKQSLKLFVANVSLSQLNWKTVPHLGACTAAAKHLSLNWLMTRHDVLELVERSHSNKNRGILIIFRARIM